MTPADLYLRIAQIMHRSDLTAQMPNFAADAQERIQRRFGVSLPYPPLDTDPLPYPYLLYLYAALQSANAFTNNGDLVQYYSEEWEKECDRQNVLAPGTSVDQFVDTAGAIVPPVIVGELPL